MQSFRPILFSLSLLVFSATEGKHVLLQGGGNWCGWCIRFHDFIEKDEGLKKLVEENYVLYHLNFSVETMLKSWTPPGLDPVSYQKK